ncbi:MAG: hypothetical protein WCF23_09825 [Candidatus Nitrosopolaris sp.]
MTTINQPDLLRIEVLLPPIRLQEKIESAIMKVELLKKKQYKSQKKSKY